MSKDTTEIYDVVPVFAVDESGKALITEEQYSWLCNYAVRKAERVQELEKQILYLESTIESASKVTENLEEQNKELFAGLATIGNAIHEGEISGRGTDENLILEVVDKHWRNRNEEASVR